MPHNTGGETSEWIITNKLQRGVGQVRQVSSKVCTFIYLNISDKSLDVEYIHIPTDFWKRSLQITYIVRSLLYHVKF